ncbi:MAG: 50S ribosomal protein L30 [DPANN group archaeon]|nr:50S ribosomal protein L30 [DPANN group archaeon]
MTITAVRVRGNAKLRKTIEATMQMMNLKAVNNVATLTDNKVTEGMLQKAKDYVTWGTITKDTFTKMLLKWAKTVDNAKVTEGFLKEQNTSVDELYEGKKKFKDANIKATIRLHPPRKGYEGVKRPYSMKGALGNRKDKLDELVQRMI